MSDLVQLTSKEVLPTEADREVLFRRVYQDGDNRWIVLGSLNGSFEKLQAKHPNVIKIPEVIFSEVLQLNTGGTSFGVTAENLNDCFGVVSLKDYLSGYPKGAEVESWPVEAKNETRSGDVEVTDKRLGYTDKKVEICGL